MHADDAHGLRLPIKLDSTSNGEFAPIPLSKLNRAANQRAREQAGQCARHLGLSRRTFLVSLCGAASTLLSFNAVNAAVGRRGGYFELAAEAALEPELAAVQLSGEELIFDVQGHYVNPQGAWLETLPPSARPFSWAPKTDCSLAARPEPRSYLDCLGPDQFIQDVFLDSDTDMMVLSFVPSRRDAEPLTIEEAAATQHLVARMQGSHRLLLHGRVNPNQAGDMGDMERLAREFQVVAFKTYTQWGPHGQGYFLHDKIGRAFIERTQALGVSNIAVHKGLPFGRESYEHSLCDDIGVVAKDYPAMNFLVYHSGFVPGQAEGPYDPQRNEGIDSLIRSLVTNDIPTGSNVYAELGSTWRYVMRDPDSAAHALGKLFKYVGENNVLWGTDSIWYGSPQDQIQAFRAFQIAAPLRERYGYPALTPELRAKVFGLNAMRPYGLNAEAAHERMRSDSLARCRAAYREQPNPHFRTYGPRTRREFLNLLAWSGSGQV